MRIGQREHSGVQLAAAHLVHQHMRLLFGNGQAKLRVFAAHGGQHLGQQIRPDRGDNPHGHGKAQRLPSHGGEAVDIIDLEGNGGSACQNLLTHRGHQHLLVVALEQLYAQLRFQFSNSRTER